MNIKVRNGYFQTNFKAELLLTNERTLKKNFRKSIYILLSIRDFKRNMIYIHRKDRQILEISLTYLHT